MKNRFPRHIGFIPDGNRRWAQMRGQGKESGYARGVDPGLELFDICRTLGIEEISVYGFTQDNTRRPTSQKEAFREACVAFAEAVAERGAALLVVGDDHTPQFPDRLRRFRRRQGDGVHFNLLVNYGWDWDLQGIREEGELRSAEISRLDLIVRWGGGRRLSGFLPVQSVYADFYVIDELWPDFQPAHLHQALDWYRRQDRTLGG